MDKKSIFIELEVKDLQNLIRESVRSEFENFNPSQPERKDLINSKEACEFLKVSKVTLHKWINDGKIICYHLGSRMYFKKSELEGAVTSNPKK